MSDIHASIRYMYMDIFDTGMFVCPQEARLLSLELELKEDLRLKRDKEIELAIWTLEEEASKDKEECERAADNRCGRGFLCLLLREDQILANRLRIFLGSDNILVPHNFNPLSTAVVPVI